MLTLIRTVGDKRHAIREKHNSIFWLFSSAHRYFPGLTTRTSWPPNLAAIVVLQAFCPAKGADTEIVPFFIRPLTLPVYLQGQACYLLNLPKHQVVYTFAIIQAGIFLVILGFP